MGMVRGWGAEDIRYMTRIELVKIVTRKIVDNEFHSQLVLVYSCRVFSSA